MDFERNLNKLGEKDEKQGKVVDLDSFIYRILSMMIS